MDEEIEILCPYCGEWVVIVLDPQTRGEVVQDCEVCCNPWQLHILRDGTGGARVEVERLQ